MQSDFSRIGQLSDSHHTGDNSFWPSFTDVMMVITMIFLMATSLLVVRNWQLVAELRESIAAEQIATELIESTSQVNSTLEERLANAEQSNSILRLRLLKKADDLKNVENILRNRDKDVALLQLDNDNLQGSLEQANAAFAVASLEADAMSADFQELVNEVGRLNQQLDQQQQADETVKAQLQSARTEVETLSRTTLSQERTISSLEQERILLNEEIQSYNQQLLTLSGDYETVKSKYQELIKPARTAKGKYIAEVYYIKNQNGEIIRYRQPGYEDFIDLPLAEVEKRLEILKAEKGKDLYVKIIIPENSGLGYNEAWEFMRNLLSKYDYYYQSSSNRPD